ncbi:hypothetical protein [Bradyrhizobium sp. Tv2a-2]|uniref:hypothetical protein n=1 Tax=Bradyrhizobium sp. Tv2a-2 TaxID=113395 RepID=UPI0003F6C8AE|nr:hypothetical protein [Bradyrhizobium sp. Tv2a-2]
MELTNPKFSELSPEEKDEVIELILEHLGRDIEAFKFDGESKRQISLAARRRL